MEYQKNTVENMLRNYYALKEHPNPEFTFMYLDLTHAMNRLLSTNSVLYNTLVNVFVTGQSIVKQAKIEDISTRQVSYRLDDALTLLTDYMNGVFDEG